MEGYKKVLLLGGTNHMKTIEIEKGHTFFNQRVRGPTFNPYPFDENKSIKAAEITERIEVYEQYGELATIFIESTVDFCVKDALITELVFIGAKQEKIYQPEHPEMDHIAMTQIQRVLNAAPTDFKTPVAFMRYLIRKFENLI